MTEPVRTRKLYKWDHDRPFSADKRLFFMNGELHAFVSKNRAQGLVQSWNYPQGRTEVVLYSDAHKDTNRAYTLSSIARLLNRTNFRIHQAWSEGFRKPPGEKYNFKLYKSLEENKGQRTYYGDEQYILDLRDWFSEQYHGRSQHTDKIIKSNYKQLPTKAEVNAMLRRNQQFYVKDKNGNMVPVWAAPDL